LSYMQRGLQIKALRIIEGRTNMQPWQLLENEDKEMLKT
jgi:hypothetical protein